MSRSHVVVATAVTAVVFACLSPAVAAPGDVTLLLKSGQRVTGEFASYDRETVDIRNTSGARSPIRFDDVVLMDFVGDARRVTDQELDAARRARHLLVPRRGDPRPGTIVDFVSEGGPDAAVIFDAAQGGRQQVRLDEVARIFVGPFTDAALAAVGRAAATQLPGDVPRGGVRVPGQSRWVATGLTVRQGERIGFETTGTVYLRANQQDSATPAGASDQRRAPGSPMPDVLAGALIGRIGDRGAPFGIGNQQSLTMPASGMLYLAVNDDELSDNSGEFIVTLSRLGGRR